jgi:NAD(P)-dependent dehydrogenase (short-subunit alcohol dehydrogenase family)
MVVDEEPSWASNCFDEMELKKRGMEALKNQGESPTPVKVQKLLNPILASREITGTLRAVREAGGDARYVSADVTDAEGLQRRLAVAEAWGGITGVIHGAGVLADRLIEKKTAQDFDAVYSTKIKGLEALLRSVDPAKLKHLVLFSSAAGFFGNPGQSDYAVANEVLNKTAYQFQQRYPDCHVITFNWGPWDGGMVTESLKRLFAERGIHVIPIDGGTQLFVNAFRVSKESGPQILVGSWTSDT